MNLIERHIEYLMMDHDCVIVPGLGAFLAHRFEATYDMERELFSSPGRRYAFNGELSSTDGLLTMSVARALGTDCCEASRRIEECVADMRRELDMTGSVVIGRLGRLEKDEDGIVSFESAPLDFVTPIVDWMPEIAVSPLGSLRRQREIAQKEEIEAVRPRRFAHFVRTAIGAAAAILIAIVVSTPVAVKDTYQASTALPEVKIVDVTVPDVKSETNTEVIEPVAEVVAGDAVLYGAPADEIVSEPAPVVEAPNPDATNTSFHFDERDQYVVVVASLANEHEVDKYLEQQSRINKDAYFGVIHSGRYHRVYVATGATRDQAVKQSRLPWIRDRFEGAWVTCR